MVIFVALMATAFLGYLLPWGNMSYWGAQVIISLFDAIPFVGPSLAEWIRGDFVVSDATLNRFFALHFFIPVIILPALVFVHIVALHKVGSSNPDGIEIKKKKGPDGKPLDGIPFHPYFTVKDIAGVAVFLMFFSAVVFFAPELGGWFLEADNFVPANILQTPTEIVPLWYFTPFYSILRAITTDMVDFGLVPFALILSGLTLDSLRDMMTRVIVVGITVAILLGMFTMQAKVWGVIMMGLSLVLFFFLPWLDRSPVKSIRYRGWMYKSALTLFSVSFVILGYLGTKSPEAVSLFLVKNVYWVQIFTVVYFAFFLFMPWYTTLDKTKPVPERVTP